MPASPPLSRRHFLRTTGACLALPWLELHAGAASAQPWRMLFVMSNMGVIPKHFFPEAEGAGYETTPYLELLRENRERFTVFSGLSHPGVGGAHLSEKSFLSGAPHPETNNFRNTISVDQWVAEKNASQTRFSSLVLMVGKPDLGFPSVTRDGVAIPPLSSPAALYKKLFVQGSPAEVEEKIFELRHGRSILDFVRGEASALKRHAGVRDRDRIDQYFTAVRAMEKNLVEAEAWEKKPKPKVEAEAPKDIGDDGQVEAESDLMFSVLRQALETDSTRVASLYLGPLMCTAKIPGVSGQTHGLTHHGGDEAKLEQLRRVEEAVFRSFNRFLSGMHGVRQAGGTLLEKSLVLFGSNLGNANSHDTTNLPILLAGGGFRHGKHLRYDRSRNAPLANLFVSMLQRAGFEADKFASSTGTLSGLEHTA